MRLFREQLGLLGLRSLEIRAEALKIIADHMKNIYGILEKHSKILEEHSKALIRIEAPVSQGISR